MPELAVPRRIEGSDPDLEIHQLFNVNTFLGGNSEVAIFTPTGQGYWRIRSVNIAGAMNGTAGTNSLGLQMFAGSAVSSDLAGLQYVSQVDYDFAFDDLFSVTWSTEVGASYGGKVNVNWGRIFNVALPLLYIAQGVVVGISSRKNAGSDIDVSLQDGSMQVEYFPPGSIGPPGAAEFNLYLQPQ